MNLLAFETSAGKCSVAILCNGKVFYSESEDKFMQSEKLFPMIVSLSASINLKISDMDVVACSIGPGSFTGIRIGIAAARGIKKASSKVKLIGISNLELIAHAIKDEVGAKYSKIITIVDAYKDEYYMQEFDKRAKQLSDITIINKEELINIVAKGELVVSDKDIDINAKLVAKAAKEMIDNNILYDNVYPLYVKNPSIGSHT